MTLDESFNKFLENKFTEIFGPNYRQISGWLNSLIDLYKKQKEQIGTIDQRSQKIAELEKTVGTLSRNIDIINGNQAGTINQLSQKIADLEKADSTLSGNIGIINRRYDEITNQLSQKIAELEKADSTFSERIGIINKHYDEITNQLSQKIADLEKADSTLFRNIGIINGNHAGITNQFSQLSQKIAELEKTVGTLNDKNRELAKKITDLEPKNKPLPSRIDENVQIDGIITQFNSWAANPTGHIPPGFAFLDGNFKILTKQPLTKTKEETNWITNENGEKKYLFPNPNSFDQMTDICELYAMNQNMLKEKGRNKIEITTACEISASGWIDFAGKLKILP
jgi:ABC-type transporter Mla subunit MlaD